MPSPSKPRPPRAPAPSPPAVDTGASGHAVAAATLDAVFGALAHPARRQILLILHARGGTMTAGEIADRFKHAWPTTTRHLGVLEEAGLLHAARHGRQRLYTLDSHSLLSVGRWLISWSSTPPAGAGERPTWASLPYATMRNTIPPGGPSQPPREK